MKDQTVTMEENTAYSVERTEFKTKKQKTQYAVLNTQNAAKVPPIDLQAEFREIRSEFQKRAHQIFTSGRYVLGREVREFEENFARFVGAKYAVGVASGSDALLLSLMALRIKAGDEILTTPFTFIATATAIARLGAKPVFVDIDSQSFNLDPAFIRKKVTKRTRGIVLVHLYGNPCRMDEISTLAKQLGLFIVEDCAQACGATFQNKQVGSFGEFGAFSFYPTKTLGALGDAGAITTNQRSFYEKVKSLHLHGENQKSHTRRSYRHTAIGINSRLDEIQAAILNVKLGHLEKWNHKRRKAADTYDKLILSFVGVRSPHPKTKGRGNPAPTIQIPVETPNGYSVYHQYTIRAPRRDALLNHLKRQGIFAGIYYPISLHLQPCFRYLGYKRGDFQVAEKASREVLSLPLYPQIQLKEQRLVTSAIKRFYH